MILVVAICLSGIIGGFCGTLITRKSRIRVESSIIDAKKNLRQVTAKRNKLKNTYSQLVAPRQINSQYTNYRRPPKYNEYKSTYRRPQKYNDYKSTKPVREMDGWEQKQFNDVWGSMSPEEKRKQIYREFGDIVDIQE